MNNNCGYVNNRKRYAPRQEQGNRWVEQRVSKANTSFGRRSQEGS